MASTKHFAAAVAAAPVLFIGPTADAKGPQGGGGGAGAASSHSASPNSQGIGSNTWSQPPGWSNSKDTNGWGGADAPPGWDNNTTGQTNGWNGADSPPGLEKR